MTFAQPAACASHGAVMESELSALSDWNISKQFKSQTQLFHNKRDGETLKEATITWSCREDYRIKMLADTNNQSSGSPFSQDFLIESLNCVQNSMFSL